MSFAHISISANIEDWRTASAPAHYIVFGREKMRRPHGCQTGVILAVAVFACVIVIMLWSFAAPEEPDARASANQLLESPHTAFFTDIPPEPYAIPKVTELDLPVRSGYRAIWGGTGRDDRGHIWLGLCAEPQAGASACLIEYDPEKSKSFLRGDVLSALARHRSLVPAEAQAKIHTKIIQASDGNLYFASLDETGGDFDGGTRSPKWGSHLWRVKLPGYKWEHLFSAEEGLIAVAGGGWTIYALGFFGHKLYRYNIKTEEVKSVEVGSVGGHISRNIVSDFRNHVYVPRIKRGMLSPECKVSIVECDTNLQEIGETPIKNYLYEDQDPAESHGLTAFQPMVDGSIIVVTAPGYMYRIYPGNAKAAQVEEIGWLHPEGERYVASLFTYGGKRYVMGLAKGSKNTHEGEPYQWVIRDLSVGVAITLPFEIHSDSAPALGGCLLYGSVTRDNSGDFYVVGSYWDKGRPIALRVHCPPLHRDSGPHEQTESKRSQ